jgi:hypothetical protein
VDSCCIFFIFQSFFQPARFRLIKTLSQFILVDMLPQISPPQQDAPSPPFVEKAATDEKVEEMSVPPQPPAKKQPSLLPAWLLASKKLTSEVRRNSLECQENLARLKGTVGRFNDLIARTKQAEDERKKQNKVSWGWVGRTAHSAEGGREGGGTGRSVRATWSSHVFY